MIQPDGAKIEISLLRPVNWFNQKQNKLGGKIYLSLGEFGANGWATITALDTAKIQIKAAEANYRVVIGTFIHQSTSVWELEVEGLSKPIGVTANHPIWSIDRNAWVSAGDLIVGEQLATRGLQAKLLGKTYLPGQHKVYNIEVAEAHNYFVGDLGILVHNVCPGGYKFKRVKNGGNLTTTTTLNNGKKISLNSGHGYYQLHKKTGSQFEGLGLGIDDVETAILKDVELRLNRAETIPILNGENYRGPGRYQIEIRGQKVEYRLHYNNDETMFNIGNYYPVMK